VTKLEIVSKISARLNVDAPKMSTGSTEPREIFDLVNDTLGLGIDKKATKPEMARQIVEASGMSWNADYESRGGTVTKAGLHAVLTAVEHFVGN
jgi:Mn-containing catalase